MIAAVVALGMTWSQALPTGEPDRHLLQPACAYKVGARPQLRQPGPHD